MARPNLTALTSLRFFTALHVFLFHIEAAQVSWAPEAVRKLASVGYVGVNWFFVLSGFILAYSYEGRPVEKRRFWQARLARIYPAYLVAFLLAAPVFVYICRYTPLPAEQSWIGTMCDQMYAFVLLGLFLLQSWLPSAALSVNPVGWSLSVEAFFYFLFPFLLTPLARLSGKRLATILCACAVASVIMAFGYVCFAPDGVARVRPEMNDLYWLNVLRFNPLIRLPEFLVGLCGALLFLRYPQSQRWATPLIIGGLGVFCLAALNGADIPYPLLHNGLLSLPFLAIIFGFAHCPAWAAAIECRPLQSLGEVSYSFFLTHGLVIALFFRPDGNPSQPHAPLDVLSCLAVALFLAYILYYGVEQPVRRRFAKSKTVPLVREVVSDGN